MGRGVKCALASTVLLLGTIVAMLFHHPSSPAKIAKPADLRRPVLRRWTAPSGSPKTAFRRPVEVARASAARHPRAMIRASLERNEPPPGLARVYPRPNDSPLAGPAEVADYRLPRPADSRPALRIHKVADGDTLVLLAERYLGSAERAKEIFALNREVLDTPDALPIGSELRIPARSARVVQDDEMLPARPLVPVRQ